MKRSIVYILFIGLMAITLMGFGAYAFAHMERGYGYHGWGHHGPGWHHDEWSGSKYGDRTGNLSDDEIEQLENERESFINATDGLRQNIRAKEFELRSELAKENPNTTKAAKLQKEISDLIAEFDQKRLDHVIRMKKINPEAGKRFGHRWGGGSGGGYCWR